MAKTANIHGTDGGSVTVGLPVLVPDRNSASGYRVEQASIEVDAGLASVLSEGRLPMTDALTDDELKAFGTYLSRVDPKLPPAAQPFARNMVQQIDAKLAGTFNPEPGKFEKYFNAQLVRFVMAGGTL